MGRFRTQGDENVLLAGQVIHRKDAEYAEDARRKAHLFSGQGPMVRGKAEESLDLFGRLT